jgi:hypothetical protein
MYELFEVPWDAVELSHVTALLEASEPEPLVWEAKGGDEIKPDEVRRQAGAFANSSEGGYLILGASYTDGCWVLDGMKFPQGEPPRFVSSCLQHNIRPRPTFDVRCWSVGDGRHVAVVQVFPLEAGPCVVGGTVHERIPGAVVRVSDPGRLAELISRGQRAHEAARRHAADAVDSCVPELPDAPHVDANDEGALYVAVGVASLAPLSDVSSRLFRESTRESMAALGEGLAEPVVPLAPTMIPSVAQNRRVVTISTFEPHRPNWAIAGFWTGATAVAARAVGHGTPKLIVDEFVVPAYAACVQVAQRLGASDTGYLQVLVQDHRVRGLQDGVNIARGPIALALTGLDRESVTRELSRSMGHDVPEPEA